MESLPVPVPPCPACGAAVAIQGDERVCTRCGRAFAVEVTGAASGGASAYREAPIVSLVLREEEPPESSRLTVAEDPLDVTIGTRAPKVPWLAISLVITSTVILAGRLPRPLLMLAVLLPLLGLLRLLKRNHDRVTIAPGTIWMRIERRRGQAARDERIAMRDVVGSHLDDGHIRLDLADGTTVTVGEGLDAPEPVVRWLARRIARALPDRG